VWKKDQYEEWKNLFPLVTKANNFWLEFDADNHLDKLHGLDQPKNISRFFYKVFEPATKFIWEQPIWYNPLLRDVERISLRFYTTKFEKPINPSKDIDFFTVLDTDKNVLETLELFTKLHSDGYKVCVMIINKNLYEFYQDKLDYPIVTNEPKFRTKSVKRFEELMARSKVYVDLSYRLTTGRVVYDALFHGAYFVGTYTYGATDWLFPEYVVSSYPVLLPHAYEKCIEALGKWSVDNVKTKRAWALRNAGIKGFIEELKARSE
jgi:hypothetical protein